MTKKSKGKKVLSAKSSSLIRKAKRVLAAVEKNHHDQRHHLIMRQFQEAQKALGKTSQDLVRAKAKFRFDHSKEIVNAIISDPRNYPQVVDLYRTDLIDWNRFGEFVQTVNMLEGLGYENTDRGGAVPVSNSPIITSCPSPLKVNEIYTLLGSRFGTTTGEIRIEANTEPTVIYPEIRDWSDTAVSFVIPATVKIPFSAQGLLTLKRADAPGGSHYWTDDPNTTINVLLLSEYSLYHSRAAFSDDGSYGLSWKSYANTVILNSPLLPKAYTLFANNYFTTDGLLLTCSDNADIILSSGATANLLEGLYESGNSLYAKVKITAGRKWDFTVYADFYILVPAGYSIPAGWSR